jgi:hypothetical protein
MRKLIYKLLLLASRVIGMKIRDQATGKVLGRALCIPFGGKIHWFGYTGTQFVSRIRASRWPELLAPSDRLQGAFRAGFSK